MKYIWFLFSLLFLYVFFGDASDLLSGENVSAVGFSVGAYLFLYSLSKIYFHYSSMTGQKLFSFLETIFPLVILLGVKNKFGDESFYLIDYLVLTALVIFYSDMSRRIRKLLMSTFIARGWEDDLEQKLLFSKFPPRDFSDMIGWHIVIVSCTGYLFV